MEDEGRVASPYDDIDGDDDDEEEVSALPKNTKVVITGNNRTKSFLIGLRGVVKNAASFRGWHWLVLTNGVEVKLQRNALSVIELPTAHDEEVDNVCENPSSNSMEPVSEDFQKIHKPRVRPRMLAASTGRSHCQSTGSNFHSHGMLKVDFSKLETSALWRYRRHFNLVEVGPNSSRDQLVGAVERHFISQGLDSHLQFPEVLLQIVFKRSAAKYRRIIYASNNEMF